MAIVEATMVRTRVLAAGMAVLATSLAGPTINGAAEDSPSAITCTNPYSGTSWQIIIDYRKSTVDQNAAAITPSGISWFDPKDGGNYALDRESGDLTASVASSTGGYFRRAHCALTPR